MASDVEIVNNALSLLGDDVITSLGDDTPRARLASTIFDSTRDTVLRSFPWNCAVARASLGKLSDAPAFEWKNQFQLPTDPYCLRALEINGIQVTGYSGREFAVEGRRVLTNSATVNLRFIKRITDPNEYDALLYEALSARLAAKMAYPITSSSAKSQEMWQLYTAIIKEARSVNGEEGSAPHIDISILRDVR